MMPIDDEPSEIQDNVPRAKSGTVVTQFRAGSTNPLSIFRRDVDAERVCYPGDVTGSTPS